MRSTAMPRTVAALLLCGVTGNSWAIDWTLPAHAQDAEVTYAPSQIDFQIDQAVGACAAGSWLFY